MIEFTVIRQWQLVSRRCRSHGNVTSLYNDDDGVFCSPVRFRPLPYGFSNFVILWIISNFLGGGSFSKIPHLLVISIAIENANVQCLVCGFRELISMHDLPHAQVQDVIHPCRLLFIEETNKYTKNAPNDIQPSIMPQRRFFLSYWLTWKNTKSCLD